MTQKSSAQAHIDQPPRRGRVSAGDRDGGRPAAGFYPAEAYHQDYLNRHPNDPYIAFHDWPKIDSLRKKFPVYVER
jgi:peptide-methionine (S)-S-oxide reductase